MIYDTPIFPTWTHLWNEQDRQYAKSTSILESLLAKRNRTLPNQPKGDLQNYIKDLHSFSAIYDAASADGLHSSRADRRRLLASLRQLVPLIEAGMWARWLDIEKGLSLTLQQENLLGSALLARTLAEESLRAITLSNDCNRLIGKENKDPISSLDIYKIAYRFHTWALPRIRQRTVDELGQKSQTMSEECVNPEIDEVRARLNDYVHPNYGSHRAAYDLTGTTAAITIIESLIIVYQNFFQDPWLNPVSAKNGRRNNSLSDINERLKTQSIDDAVAVGRGYQVISDTALESGVASP